MVSAEYFDVDSFGLPPGFMAFRVDDFAFLEAALGGSATGIIGGGLGRIIGG